MKGSLLLISIAIMFAMSFAAGTACCQGLEKDAGPWRRDPFRYDVSEPQNPKISATQKSEELAAEISLHGLNGIIRARDGKYRALINDREYQEGDRVGELRILGISRFNIVVEDGSGSREIDLFHHQIKWGDQ